MIGGQKDTTEVVNFMRLFTRLKDWCDNDPESLAESSQNDDGLKRLCIGVLLAAYTLTIREQSQRHLFAAPVDPTFLAARRNYQDRFERSLFRIFRGENLESPEPTRDIRDEACC
jgi:hypothetical protein